MYTWRLKVILLLAQALSGQAGIIGGELATGVHSAGLLGSYAGTLSGGEALARLDLNNEQLHEGGVEKLGELGDHLGEHSFPADYGSSDAGLEYAEASEHHVHYEPELEHHGEQPVPGIDHGKGAFSYSTLYEFKDRQEHELHQLEHQLEEEHIEQQLELEHQQHLIEHQLDSH